MPLTIPQTAMLPEGFILQAVHYKNAAHASWTTPYIPQDDTVPQITEGLQLLNLSITPKAANSKLYIAVHVQMSASTAVHWGAFLFKDSDVNAVAGQMCTTSTANYADTVAFIHEFQCVSTTTLSFTVRVGSSSGTLYTNGFTSSRLYGGVLGNTITITEVKQ